MTNLEKVLEFIKGTKQTINKKPTMADCGTFNLRMKLIYEELDEFYESYLNNDLIGIFDALIDIDYVLKGTIIAFGLQDKYQQGFDEVHNSNMTKLIDMEFENGKIIKGDNYIAPNLKNILEV